MTWRAKSISFNRLLDPATVTVVGACKDPLHIGSKPIAYMLRQGLLLRSFVAVFYRSTHAITCVKPAFETKIPTNIHWPGLDTAWFIADDDKALKNHLKRNVVVKITKVSAATGSRCRRTLCLWTRSRTTAALITTTTATTFTTAAIATT